MMNRFERDKDKALVVQDNFLVEASYTLTLNEKRIILLGVSKIDSRPPPSKVTPYEFDITVAEWEAVFPTENPFLMMKRASDNMLTRHVTLHPKTGHVKKMSWFDSVEYFDGEGRIRVRFGWSISQYLGGLYQDFTKYNLLDIRQLNSIYAIRIYELMMQYKSTGYRRMSLDDFRIAMDCVDAYPNMRDLRKRVLDIAVREINEKTNIKLEVTDLKKGRKVVGFEFVIKSEKQGDLFKGGI